MFGWRWETCLTILVFVIIFLWMFTGSHENHYVGLTPILEADKPLDSVMYPDPVKDLEKRSGIYNRIKSTMAVSEESTIFHQPTQPPIVAGKSRGEQIACRFLERYYGRAFKTCRPDFLKNPETGQNLELDGYNPELKIACEYNGQQHYVYPNSYHKTKEEFISQVRRDQWKLRRCEEEGVYLIRIPYTVPYRDIEKYIEDRLPENYSSE